MDDSVNIDLSSNETITLPPIGATEPPIVIRIEPEHDDINNAPSTRPVDIIYGTDEGDALVASKMRSGVFGEDGNDFIEATKYLVTANGGDGDDILIASTSYVELNGDAGDDLLVVSTDPLGENIANVTMTGSEGADTFGFLPREQKIFSAIITDFNAAEGDVVIIAAESDSVLADEASDVSLGAVVGVERIDDETMREIIQANEVTAEEEALKQAASAKVSGDVLRYITDSDGEVTDAFLRLSRSDDTLGFTLLFQGITDVDAFEDSALIYADYNGTAMNRVRLGDLHMPDGLSMGSNNLMASEGNLLYVYPEYEGDLWLGGIDFNGNAIESWTSGSIKNISARNDTVSGRMLAGNYNLNHIYASDYGNSIWGGLGDGAYLYGGAGADTFIAATGEVEEYTNIRDCGENDVVYLDAISSEDIFSSDTANVYIEGYDVGDYFNSLWHTMTFTSDNKIFTCISNRLNDALIYINPEDDARTTTIQLSNGYRLQINYADGVEWYGYEDEVWVPLAIKTGGLQTFTTDNGDMGLYVYSNYSGGVILDIWDYFSPIKIIDARNDDYYTRRRVLTGNANDNTIYANNMGSSLWGGSGGNDLLIGGLGVDTFVAGKNEGNTTIDGCEDDDLVLLKDITLEDVSGLAAITDSEGSITGMDITTNDGAVIEILSSDDANVTSIQLGDYSMWQFDYAEINWTLLRETLPYGLIGEGNNLTVTSEYEGDLWLGGVDLNGNSVESWATELIEDIDAREDTVGGRMLAGNSNSNDIYAGAGGASLWGGNKGYDDLYGGDGADTFIAGKDEGSTDIWHCADNDIVFLHNIYRDELDNWELKVDDDYSLIELTVDRTDITIWYNTPTLSKTTIRYADGETRTFDPDGGKWTDLFVDTDTNLPDGLGRLKNKLYLTSEYEGDLWLGGVDLEGNVIDGWADSEIISIDAREDTVGGRMLAGNEENNEIYAGSGGASLWGGSDGRDKLYGGDGADTFIAGQSEGHIYIYDCSDDDIVVLWNINPEDIDDEIWDKDGIYITTTDYTEIDIYYDTETTKTTTIQYANGEPKTYTHIDENMPDGLKKIVDTLYISSEYVGDVVLGGIDWNGNSIDGWSDTSVINIDATDDMIGGRLLAGNEQDNEIHAGSRGASLWGGTSTGDGLFSADELYGGDGADTFIAGQGEGNVEIHDCGDDDIVFLWNINPEDIESEFVEESILWINYIHIITNDDTTIQVAYNTQDIFSTKMATKTTIQYADGSTKVYNHIDNTGLPNGLTKYDYTVHVSSSYVGDVVLGGVDWNGNSIDGWSDTSVININATNDVIGGRLLAGNEQANEIHAGSRGASLWGGTCNGDDWFSNDELYGGEGADTFIAGKGEGIVGIHDCGDDDIVVLWNIDLGDITWSLNESDYLTATLDDDNKIGIHYNESTTTSTTVQYADGSRQRFNHSTGTWSSV